jgi:hypothetical protein
LNALDARIAADEARYRGVGEPAILAGLAYAAERRAEYLSHLALLGQAEKEWLVTARHASKDPQQQASFDAAKKVLIERQAHLEAARTALLTTGDQYKPLSPRYPAQSSGRRLALARWIADKENPLTARVAVNHVWARHLGRGLVDTPTNFGRSGHPPTHPALLDWLALEFLDGDWQSKPLHRLLVTSATYRLQSGTPSFASSHPTVDPDNRWYGRAHPRRAEAEVVRDAILACANDLDLTQGGEEIDASLGLSSRRRSLYFSSHGEGKMLFLETFDAPDVCDGYERTTSIRPQQALALANSELTWSRSRLLAQQLWEQSTHTATDERQREFVRLAFEQVLGRHVRSAELDVAERFLKKRDTPGGTELSSASRAREALVHALFNHHDFVTIR